MTPEQFEEFTNILVGIRGALNSLVKVQAQQNKILSEIDWREVMK